MGKNRKRKNRAGGGSGGPGGTTGGDSGGPTSVWGGADHAMRLEHQASKKARKREKQRQEQEQATATTAATVEPSTTTIVKQERKLERRHKLTFKLTHDSQEKREASKLRLNITKVERDIQRLRPRLERWDDVEEKERLEKEAEEERKRQEGPQKKKGRLGPETWKLKGAARPAWQVCEFDVRYECPHQKAHDNSKEKAKRVRNLPALYKGKFGQDFGNQEDLSYPQRRQFLALLMQWGLLTMEAKKYKTARLAFLECLDLDGVVNPITDARCHLMRLYLEVNRPQSVYQLWTTRLAPALEKNKHNYKETSAVVLYSVALVEYIRWKDFGEGSRKQAEASLARAFCGNILCGYYVAFCEFFHQHMEYTDEIDQAEHTGHNALADAIEYCDSEQMGMWMGTDGAVEWVQETLLRGLHGQQLAGGSLSLADLEWSPTLIRVEEEFKAQQQQQQQQQEEEENEEDREQSQDGTEDGSGGEDSSKGDDNDDDDDNNEEDDDNHHVDILMYAGMYKTTMEMLYESGALSKIPPTIVEEELGSIEEEEGGEESDTNEAGEAGEKSSSDDE